MAASTDSSELSFQDLTFDSSLDDNHLIMTSNPQIISQIQPTTPSPVPVESNVALVEAIRDYSLNLDRVLKRKIAACHEVEAEYEVTGGGITGRMDTATCELFRSACRELYREFPPEEGLCKIIDTEDKHGQAIVQNTYKVSRTIDGKVVGYTVNLYRTNNRLLINGRDVDKFMDSHLPLLHQVMIRAMSESRFRDVDAVNRMLAEQMQTVLTERRGEGGVPKETAVECDGPVVIPDVGVQSGDDSGARSASGEQDVSTTTNEETAGRMLTRTRSSSRLKQAHIQGKAQNGAKYKNGKQKNVEERCSVCGRNAVTRAAECVTGRHWVHYKCDKLTDTEIHRLETDKGFIYNCKWCLASETMPKTIVNDSRLPSFKMNNDAAVEIPDTGSDLRASIL